MQKTRGIATQGERTVPVPFIHGRAAFTWSVARKGTGTKRHLTENTDQTISVPLRASPLFATRSAIRNFKTYAAGYDNEDLAIESGTVQLVRATIRLNNVQIAP